MPRLGKSMLFASPEECERAFYEALQTGDAESMADLWLQDDEVCCVHPGSGRLLGHAAVRASWTAILAGGGMAVRAIARHGFESPGLVLSHVIEEISVRQAGGQRVVHVLATNGYVKTAGGWKMVLHMGAASPQGMPAEVDLPTGTVH
jgi:ketosteroid isomerase-like protein